MDATRRRRDDGGPPDGGTAMQRLRIPFLLAALLAMLAALPAQAERSVRSGDIVVHFNAMPSTQLTADVARQYGITRSSTRALVNISVREGAPGADRALRASVRLVATNLNGQRQDLRAREVREGDAVYYLAEAKIMGQDTLDFELEVTPEGATAPIRASFRQEFFAQ
jgi:hypothetical protein